MQQRSSSDSLFGVLGNGCNMTFSETFSSVSLVSTFTGLTLDGVGFLRWKTGLTFLCTSCCCKNRTSIQSIKQSCKAHHDRSDWTNFMEGMPKQIYNWDLGHTVMTELGRLRKAYRWCEGGMRWLHTILGCKERPWLQLLKLAHINWCRVWCSESFCSNRSNVVLVLWHARRKWCLSLISCRFCHEIWRLDIHNHGGLSSS